jgi:hypothetical protein
MTDSFPWNGSEPVRMRGSTGPTDWTTEWGFVSDWNKKVYQNKERTLRQHSVWINLFSRKLALLDLSVCERHSSPILTVEKEERNRRQVEIPISEVCFEIVNSRFQTVFDTCTGTSAFCFRVTSLTLLTVNSSDCQLNQRTDQTVLSRKLRHVFFPEGSSMGVSACNESLMCQKHTNVIEHKEKILSNFKYPHIFNFVVVFLIVEGIHNP